MDSTGFRSQDMKCVSTSHIPQTRLLTILAEEAAATCRIRLQMNQLDDRTWNVARRRAPLIG